MWQFKRKEPGWIALHSLLQAALFAENDAGPRKSRDSGMICQGRAAISLRRTIGSTISAILVVTQPQSEDKEFT